MANKIPVSDIANLGMQFEGLARAAFNQCDKYGDPFGIAYQEILSYKAPEHKIIKDEFRRALIIVLIKMVLDNPGNAELLKLEKAAWTVEKSEDVQVIVQSAIRIYESK
jgi:hypothetical protein